MNSNITTDYSDEAEINRLKQTAENIFRITFDKTLQSGSDYNAVGIKSEQILFSQRLDSRTYFIQDKRYGLDRGLGFFKGSDNAQLEMAHDILEKLNITQTEIAQQRVIKESTQEAQLDTNNNITQKSEVREGKNFVKIYRQIEERPVWSSNLILSLTEQKTIGFMQLHWPEIPRHIVNEAHRLNYKLKHNWAVPEEKSCKVQSTEAGIIHSPAIGFFMDIYPAIRVVYEPTNETGGKKKVLYFDRHARKIPTPRQIEISPDDKHRQRSEQRPSNK